MTGRSDRAWAVVSERELLSRPPYVTVTAQTVELPDGRRIDDYYQIILSDFACVYAETEDGHLLMLRSYRHGPRKICFSFPGGGIGPGEDPAEAAARELREETGFEAARWHPLGSFIINSNQRCGTAHFFRAEGCRRVADANSGDLEDSEVVLLTRAEVLAALRGGDLASLAHAGLLAIAMVDASGVPST